MATGALLVVEGQRDLLRALAKADKDTRREVRAVLAEVAAPVEKAVEVLALREITRLQPPWAEARIGVTQKLTYVVPQKRGTKVPRRKRPNLADLLVDKAYEPTRKRFEGVLEADMERAMDRMADIFNRGA